jgi:hypothetical protein
MRRIALTGASVALAYLGIVLATSLFTNHTVRPLFDGGAPPPPYRWVNPPPDFAPGNIGPKPTDLTFEVKPDALPPAGASEDAQFVFNLPKGSVPLADTSTTVRANIVPLDPDKLGPLPTKQFPNGNVYRITFTYEPGGQPAPVTIPGSVLLTVPVPAEAVMYSEDGKAWRPLKSENASATAIGADMPGAGYYLAISPDVVGSTGGGGGGIGRVMVPVVITVVVAGALVAMPVLRRRSRRR